MSESDAPEELQKELAYYKRRVDELSGENLKLDYTLSGLRHEIKQKRQGFALLSELQQTVGAEKDVSTIFETTIEAINSTLGMDRTVVLSPTEEEHTYRPAHLLGFREEDAARLAERTFLFPEEFQEGSGLLLVNKATDSTPLIEEIREAFDLPFFICVPVMGEGGPIGLLLSGRLKEARPLYPPLNQGDVDTFQAISGLISASVRNMRVAVLEEMDRLKTDFFANISHEFRTPIALTIGPLEQLLNGRCGELPAEVRERLTVMRRNQERLLGLVNQILDLAKLEAGGMELQASAVEDVNALVRERAETFRSVAEEQGVELRFALDSAAADADVYLDREKVEKVLFNLLSNAVKFTREGWIEVSTSVQGGVLQVAVTDTGVGIKEDQLPHIFDRFRQADGSESREYAGSGIGLALVKEVAELHGGDVDVLSQYGKGSTFRVTIPLGRNHLAPSAIVDTPVGEESVEPVPNEMAPEVVMEGATDRVGAAKLNEEAREAFDPDRPTVVYAEDNPDMRQHVRDLLGDEFNVFLAVDGRDGMDAVREYRPDLVITDQMMPNMSGRDFLQELRNDEELRSIPVIFLTARAGSEARIDSLDAGADDYLTKPFHEGELLARVRNLIRAREQERELAELNRRLEVRVEEQMAELVRSGELRRFLPPALAEYVERRDDAAVGEGLGVERRKITVLRADIGGLAEATEALEPEELSSMVNDCLRELTSIAVACDGTVQVSGATELMVIFGAPGEMEVADQAGGAAIAALTMQARMDQLQREWRRRGLARRLSFQAALNVGYCTVGVYGSELYRSYTAVGAPVTVAGLLAGRAEPGQILATLGIHALLDDRVESVERGTVSLEPISRPVEVFELQSIVDESLGSMAEGGPGPVFLPK